MSKRQELRVLTGSLNALNPGDKMPPGDAAWLENFRVDQDGALRSRAGTDYIWQIPGGGFLSSGVFPDVHTMGQFGSFYYFAAATSLYRAGSDTAIATGLTGNPFGIACMNGFAWIMDRNVQGRDDGTTFTTGVPQPPPSPPTVTQGPTDPNGPQGTYTYYVTFVTTIGETNPSPASAPITVVGNDIYVSNLPISADPTVIARNIYRIGGVLGQPYLVLTVNNNTDTGVALDIVDTMSDTGAAAEGIALGFDHDPPPAAQGVVGPYFGRLLAFSSAANINRMWWTKPGQPQYWPGALLADGQWVDVGDAGEAILAIVPHARHALIYKERSIWRLIGDPDTGTLELANPRYGLVGPRAVGSSGNLDYFGWVDGVYATSDGRDAQKVSGKLDNIFLGKYTDIGGSTNLFPVSFARVGQMAVEFFGGRVFVSYPEEPYTGLGNSVTAVLQVSNGNWATMRVNTGGVTNQRTGFTCFRYAGKELWGGSGNVVVRVDQGLGSGSEGYSDCGGLDPVLTSYQSRFEDCGYPDNRKMLLDVVIDCETGAADGSGDNVITAGLLLDNAEGASTVTTVGSLNATVRTKQALSGVPFASIEFTNIAIRLTCPATAPVTIHAIYLYYYVEARQASAVLTPPFQLAGGKVVQVRELQVDIDNPGAVSSSLYSDLPGNALASRETLPVPASAGRRPLQLPFGPHTVVEGRLFQFGVQGNGNLFRIYGARLLVRVVGTYIEAYEAAGGFWWDSFEQDFSTGITHIPRGAGIALYADPIKRAREIELQIETTGPVTVELWSDLPGNAQAKRASFTVNTASPAQSLVSMQVVRLPLPAGLNAPVEGRLYRLMIHGNSQFKLTEAAVEILPVGVYLEAYEAAGGAVYDSREIDLGTPKVKECRELELDIDTSGANVSILTDLPTGSMAQAFSDAISTAGRQKVLLALPLVEGRLVRLLVTSTNSFALYGARIYVRAFGQYLTGGEGTSGAFWDSTELDLGTQQVKQLRQVELDIWLYGSATVTIYTDLPGNAMVSRVTKSIGPTSGRIQLQIPLPQGAVPENYIFGRLVRVTVASSQSVKLYGARISARAIGVYVEGYEAQQGACWDSTPLDLGNPHVKSYDELRFECDTDGPVYAAVWTELPGEVMTSQYTGTVAAMAISRGWATIPLPAGIEGRSLRLIVSGQFGFRIYKVQVRARIIGGYIAAQNGSNPQDIFRTLDFDYGTERVKLFKKIELDVETDSTGSLLLTAFTNQSGVMAQVYQTSVQTSGLRQTIKLYLPMNTRGRLMRLEATSATACRIFHVRTWMRPENEPQGEWSWADYPLVPESTVMPEWSDIPVPETAAAFTYSDLPVEPTPPEWSWAPFPVAPTDAQWNWAKVLSVEGTSDKWEWVEIPGVTEEAA